MNTKVMGYLRTAREVAPHMIAQKSGRIINVSGLGARAGRAPRSARSATSAWPP